MLSAWHAPKKAKLAAAFFGLAYVAKFFAVIFAFSSGHRALSACVLGLAFLSIAACVGLCVAQMYGEAAEATQD